MPKVGTGPKAKTFPYTKKGEEMAEKEAKNTGKKLTKSTPGKSPSPTKKYGR